MNVALMFLAYCGGALLFALALTLVTVCLIAIYREIG